MDRHGSTVYLELLWLPGTIQSSVEVHTIVYGSSPSSLSPRRAARYVRKLAHNIKCNDADGVVITVLLYIIMYYSTRSKGISTSIHRQAPRKRNSLGQVTTPEVLQVANTRCTKRILFVDTNRCTSTPAPYVF